MAASARRRVLIVGNRGGTNVGESLEKAAPALGLEARVLEPREAYPASLWVMRFDNWFRGRRPHRLARFSQRVLEECREWRPEVLVTLGLAPIDGAALAGIGELGIARLNYSTDDPWNPRHRYRAFLDALPHYDAVFSTRKANLHQFEAARCRRVIHLPFGYCDALIFRDDDFTPEEAERYASEVVFCGAADGDRIPYMDAVLRAGFDLALYGSYWQRYRQTRAATRGQASPRDLRRAISGSKVALCLVRRANRDGSCMRSFEVPAIGTCMLTEDTQEHRELFGPDGESVLYFRDVAEMLEKLRWLREHEDERRRLARAAQRRVVDGKNTYRDRLAAMLEVGREAGRPAGPGAQR